MPMLHLSTLTPDTPPTEYPAVAWVRLRLADEGWLTIYPRHAPLLAQFPAGAIIFKEDGAVEPTQLTCGPGILSIRDDRVLLLSGGRDEAPP